MHFKGKITKVMLTLTSLILEGVSIISNNSAVTDYEGEHINSLFSSIGLDKIIDEVDFDMGADLTSFHQHFG